MAFSFSQSHHYFTKLLNEEDANTPWNHSLFSPLHQMTAQCSPAALKRALHPGLSQRCITETHQQFLSHLRVMGTGSYWKTWLFFFEVLIKSRGFWVTSSCLWVTSTFKSWAFSFFIPISCREALRQTALSRKKQRPRFYGNTNTIKIQRKESTLSLGLIYKLF